MSLISNSFTVAKPPKAVITGHSLIGTMANAGKKDFAGVVYLMISGYCDRGKRKWCKKDFAGVVYLIISATSTVAKIHP